MFGCVLTRRPVFPPLFLALLAAACAPPDDKEGTTPGDWAVYASDKASTKYTPLDGITRDNFSALEIAWRWDTVDQPILDADSTLWTWRYEATPLAVDGILYTTTSLSQAVAIDGATGETLWTFDPETWRDGSPPNVGFVHRGAALWEQEDGRKWLLYGTGDAYLIALDAGTGAP